MSSNLIEEVTRRVVARADAQYGEGYLLAQDEAPHVAAIIGDVLDILSAEGRLAPAVEPGLCWHDSGVTWPDGQRPRCELRAGHLGAHEWNRGDKGGTAVWTETDTTPRAEQGAEGEGVRHG